MSNPYLVDEIKGSRIIHAADAVLTALEDIYNPPLGVQLRRWPTFSRYFGGYRPKEFSILCGATGSGKTAMLATMSADLVEQNVKHVVMSVETGPYDFIRRVCSVFAGEDLNTGDPLNLEKQKLILDRAVPQLAKKDLIVSLYENRVPSEMLIEDLIRARQEFGCRVAFIDNLNFFLEVKKAQDMVYEMDKVTHDLIIFCKKIDMHIVMVMHPKKNSNPRDLRVESEFEIKGSSTAVQEAHNIFLFNRKKPDDDFHGAFDRELIIAKIRKRGQFAGESVWFNYDKGAYHEGHKAKENNFLTGASSTWKNTPRFR